MKRIFIALALAAMAFANLAFAGDGTIRRSSHPVKGTYIVQFNVPPSSALSTGQELLHLHGGTFRHVFSSTISGMSFTGSEAAAEAISRDPRVASVEENTQGQLLQVAPATPPGWALDRIDQTALPLSHTFTNNYSSGNGIAIYFLDGGINHIAAEFGTRVRDLWHAPSLPNFDDEVNHGTSVAAIAAGSHYGVATYASIVNVRVANATGGAAVDDAIAGIGQINADWAAHNLGLPLWQDQPGVVNVSLRFVPASNALDDAVRDSISRGLVYVCGAGNGTYNQTTHLYERDDPTIGSPSRLGKPNTAANPFPQNTLTVGATSLTSPWSQDNVAFFPAEMVSSIGAPIDIWAPGYHVDTIDNTGALRSFNGTSAATPYVTGATARYLTENLGISNPYSPDYVQGQVLNAGTLNLIVDPVTGTTNLSGADNRLLFVQQLGRPRP